MKEYSKAVSRMYLYLSDAEKWPVLMSVLSSTGLVGFVFISRSLATHFAGSQ